MPDGQEGCPESSLVLVTLGEHVGPALSLAQGGHSVTLQGTWWDSSPQPGVLSGLTQKSPWHLN